MIKLIKFNYKSQNHVILFIELGAKLQSIKKYLHGFGAAISGKLGASTNLADMNKLFVLQKVK